ncbi:hypothetical protein GCM10008949_18650 [Deinococcus humi]|nr:hypothetical protein GCM10008949_18650 [Deinococcus humi]
MNGVRIIDASTYQLGVSALDASKTVVRTGTISTPTLSELSAGSATVQVCGQIQSQDVLTAAIALDSTGSMADNDPSALRKGAALSFVDRMTVSDQATVLSFDTATTPTNGLDAAHVWQDFTSDKTLLRTAVAQATFDGGGTPLYDAINDANTLLTGKTGANKSILVLTDGEDNSSGTPLSDVIARAKQSGVRVFAIGLDAEDYLDFTELENIASQTGGLFQKASDAAQLTAYFDNVFNAVNAQGCLQLNFTVKPATGTTVTGKISFTIAASGKADAQLNVPFSLTVR